MRAPRRRLPHHDVKTPGLHKEDLGFNTNFRVRFEDLLVVYHYLLAT
jgi:hypothetical protein